MTDGKKVNMSRKWLVYGAIFLTFAVCRPSSGAPAGKSSLILNGTVHGPDGKPMEAVTVSAASVGETITTYVFTDTQGHYYFPIAPAGKYRVWAQAVGYQAGRADVELNSRQGARQDFDLKTLKEFERQLTSPEWLAALPDEKPEDIRLKQIFVHNCTTCHSAAFALQNKFDEAGWKAILARMETINVYGKAGEPPSPIIQHYKDELAPYLAKVRGPGPSPLNIKPYPRPTGEAARAVVTEFNVPSAANPDELVDQDGSDWAEGIPSGGNGSAGLHDLTIDRKGNAWVTNGTENRNRSFLKLDVETGKATNFRLPAANGFARGTHGITQDANGIIWINVFENGGTFGRGSLLRLDPQTEKYEVFAPPAEMGSVGISVDDDRVAKLDPTTRRWTVYNLPSHGSNTRFITLDKRKDSVEIWEASFMTSKIIRLQFRTEQQMQALSGPKSSPAL